MPMPMPMPMAAAAAASSSVHSSSLCTYGTPPPPPYSSSYRIIKNELNRGSISASAPGYSANPPELARINPVVDTQKNPRLTPLVEEKDGFWVLKPENHVGINPAEKVIFSSLPPLFLRFLNSNDLSWITF